MLIVEELPRAFNLFRERTAQEFNWRKKNTIDLLTQHTIIRFELNRYFILNQIIVQIDLRSIGKCLPLDLTV